jgi:hypothetical protein
MEMLTAFSPVVTHHKQELKDILSQNVDVVIPLKCGTRDNLIIVTNAVVYRLNSGFSLEDYPETLVDNTLRQWFYNINRSLIYVGNIFTGWRPEAAEYPTLIYDNYISLRRNGWTHGDVITHIFSSQ